MHRKNIESFFVLIGAWEAMKSKLYLSPASVLQFLAVSGLFRESHRLLDSYLTDPDTKAILCM